MLKWQKGKQW